MNNNTSQAIEVHGVSKYFPNKRGGEPFCALRDVSFTARAGEFVSVIGPSGCGKTTLMRILHGLEQATEGEVYAGNIKVEKPDNSRAIVFQQFNLFPWRTVLDNIAFGLEVQNLSRKARLSRAKEMMDLVGLQGFEDHYAHELSGGMQQRVGIARALAVDPAVLLMDEPLGALDAITREILQREINDILSQSEKTVIFITHNISEAIFFSNRVIVFGIAPGRIMEVVDVPTARPRSFDDVIKSKEFGELREHLWQSLSAAMATRTEITPS